MLLDAIVMAGGDPERDAGLLAYAGGAPCKALIELGGQTFLERIVPAILGSGRVGRTVVVGLPPEHRLDLGPQVSYVSDAGSMLQNGEAGVRYFESTGRVSERILVASCDVPLITPEIVRHFVDRCLSYDVDFCYPIVSQEAMEQAFPGSGRTFVPLVDGRFAGADLSVVKPTILEKNVQKIDELIGQRKTFWKQVRAVGLGVLFLFLIRRLTIAKIERRVCRVLDITGKVIISPHPELAMDVDKPHHLDVVRTALLRRAQTG